MAIQTMHDVGDDYQVTPKMDGGLYASGITDCVCKGVGDEFTLVRSDNSLQVSFNAGSQAVIGGSFFKVTSSTSITLTANATIYLCANIDLSKPNGYRGSFVERTSANMTTDNLNGSGVSRDLLLYVIKTGANSITSVEDKRLIKGDGTALSGIGITMGSKEINFIDSSSNGYKIKFRVMTTSSYNSLSSKDPDTLYFIYG